MYELNGSALNAQPINGAEVFEPFTATGDGALISVEQSIQRTESGALFTVEQTVARIGSGSLIAIEQTIDLNLSGSGSLVDIEQSIQQSESGALFSIEQSVREAVDTSNIARFGFDVILYIGGVQIPSNQIHGAISIIRNENSAALMDFTLINLTGAIDLNQWHGKRVTLDLERASGLNRMYTGTVDLIDPQIVEKKINFSCTDRRNELINEQLASQLPFIGNWSGDIFDTPEDTAEELEHRLQTTTQTVDFDAYGNYTIADFLPKTTADFVLSDADIYRRKPTVKLASRGRLVNRVNVEFEYRYSRLRHRERTFEVVTPTFCEYMTLRGLDWFSTQDANSTVDSFSWTVKPSSESYTFLPPPGWYNCGEGKFGWLPVIYQGKVIALRDEEGNIVYDSSGYPVTTTINSSTTDLTEGHVLGITWTGSKRFVQDVAEKVNIQVSAPQSISQYGVIEKSQRNGMSIDYDAADFEANEIYESPTGFISTSGDWYLDKNGSPAEYKAALTAVVAIAETKIIKSHRDNHVTIETPIWPEVDLKHTVQTTAGAIQCKGKVSQILHQIDIGNRIASTTTRLSLSRAQGSQAAGSLSFPILNAPLIGESNPGTLTTNLYASTSGTPVKNEGITSPAIDDESRNRQEVENDYTYDIPLRNDSLTVTF